MKRLNILITGATGFIGRHLAAALSNTQSVRCLVRETSDISVLENSHVEIFYGNLLIKESLLPALDGIDLVYHLAGEVYSRRKDDYYKGNVLATQNLLEACKEKGTKRIIFLSSVGVYKPVTKRILLTEESECRPISFYGKTKLDAESLIKRYNIPWVIVRAPVVYGPHQPAVLNRFFLDVLIKRKIRILGKGDNLRSLCYIDNLVEGLLLLTNNTDTNRKMYILSDSSPYTINEIIKSVSKIIQQKVEIVYLPSFFGKISWRIYLLMEIVFGFCFVELYAFKKMEFHEGCDIRRSHNEIGYTPRVALQEGIESTIGSIKKLLEEYKNGK